MPEPKILLTVLVDDSGQLRIRSSMSPERVNLLLDIIKNQIITEQNKPAEPSPILDPSGAKQPSTS